MEKKSKKYYWLKLKDDFFRNPKIKKLRKIAGGDTYTIILQKMMLLSVSSGGVIEFQGIEKNFSEELALILDEDTVNVEMTLSFMLANGLIENLEGDIFILPFMPELIGSESDSAERMRRLREKKTTQLPSQCDAVVTKSDTEIRDKRKENKREEIDKRDDACDALVVDIISDFDLFWNAYPKKVGKDAALKAWSKKEGKPSIHLVLEAIERYKLSKAVHDGFTCNPATWINEGRWSDEYKEYNKNGALPDGVNIFDLIGR